VPQNLGLDFDLEASLSASVSVYVSRVWYLSQEFVRGLCLGPEVWLPSTSSLLTLAAIIILITVSKLVQDSGSLVATGRRTGGASRVRRVIASRRTTRARTPSHSGRLRPVPPRSAPFPAPPFYLSTYLRKVHTHCPCSRPVFTWAQARLPVSAGRENTSSVSRASVNTVRLHRYSIHSAREYGPCVCVWRTFTHHHTQPAHLHQRRRRLRRNGWLTVVCYI